MGKIEDRVSANHAGWLKGFTKNNATGVRRIHHGQTKVASRIPQPKQQAWSRLSAFGGRWSSSASSCATVNRIRKV
jgi:hypothetical protein